MQFTRIGPAPRIALEWSGEGPLVVFLHGIGGNRHSWAKQLPVIAERFTAVAWDVRGYLDSDDYPGVLTFDDLAADLERVLDAHGVDQAHLVGASMGGRIALHFYRRWPERVASLVLADTSAGSEVQASPQKIEEFLALRRKPLLEGKSTADIAPDIARTLVAPHCPPNILAEAIAGLSALRRDSYLKTLEATTRFNDFPRYDSIKVPTLVIVGEHDRLATPEFARRVVAQLPIGTLRIVGDAGHLSNQEKPEAFNQELMRFLVAQDANR